MTITLDVTAERILHGQAGECNACPIALAMQDHFFLVDGAKSVSAHQGCMTFLDESENVLMICNTPQAACSFMNAFDGGKTVLPFQFQATFYKP